MDKCKLTTQDRKTRKHHYNEIVWEVGKWESVQNHHLDVLCTDAYIHFYCHPLLATLMNTYHGLFHRPRLWQIETRGRECYHHELLGGAREVRLVKELPYSRLTSEIYIAFALSALSRLSVFREVFGRTTRPVDDWLSGQDWDIHAVRSILTDCRARVEKYCHKMLDDPYHDLGCWGAFRVAGCLVSVLQCVLRQHECPTPDTDSLNTLWPIIHIPEISRQLVSIAESAQARCSTGNVQDGGQ